MTKEMMVIIAFFVFVLIKSIFIEPNALNVTKYEIEDNQLQGIRIAYLSDFHLKRRDYKRLDRIVNLTNAQNPNVVLLGGDFARGHNINAVMNPEVMASKLSLLNAPTYAVLGNEDWWTDGNAISNALKENGIRVLENSSIRIILKQRYVDFAGIADYTTQQPKIAQALRRTAQPRIVFTHNPDVYYDIVDDVNLVLAGHTHGGQFIVPFTKPMFVPSKFGSEFASGLVRKTRNKLIISRGLGTSSVPVRLNCKPEIVIVDFVRVGTVIDPPGKKKRK